MNDSSQPRRARPVWVWIICIFYFLTAGLSLLVLALVFSGASMSAEQTTYFASMTLVEKAFSASVAVASLAGAVSLFLRRRIAVIFFASALALSVALTGVQLMRTNVAELHRAGLFSVLLAWSALAVVIGYAYLLGRKGELQ
jgi:hypothetical protein